MTAPALAIVPADAAHIDAIVAIERDAGSASVVALTHGHAVREAIARGHDVIVALDGNAAAGWAWYAVEDGRDGEPVGQLYRVAVAASSRRAGVAAALVAHAGDALRARGCRRLRATVGAADGDALPFFRAAGFADDAIIVEATL